MLADDGSWRETLTVRSFEMGADGRLQPAALLARMQEAAGNSARALGFPVEAMLARGLTWVLARLRVEIERWPRWREPWILETWPSLAEGARAHREFVALDADGAVLARATSLWTAMDVRSRRPSAIPDFVHAVRRSSRAVELADVLGALRSLPEAEQGAAARSETSFEVRWGDLDLNRHANNVAYVDWFLDALPAALRDGQRLAALSIDYRGELRLGDRLGSTVALLEGPEGVRAEHRLTRTADGREVAVARTLWTPGVKGTGALPAGLPEAPAP